MGEYAKFRGNEIKIGTCEDMYYLRYDQRQMVQKMVNNVDPNGADALGLRFRFPWPDEDKLEPGSFSDHGRSIPVYGHPVPDGVEHYTVQFVARAPGYLCSLPCPEGPGPHPVKTAKNGFVGSVHLVQQKLLVDGRLVPILRCGGCGALWRCEEPEEIQAVAMAFFDEGNRRRKDSWTDAGEHVGHIFWHEVAMRILAGAHLELEHAGN